MVAWVVCLVLAAASIVHGISALSPMGYLLGSAAPVETLGDPADWTQLRHDVSGTGYTAAAGIDSSNVTSLTERWSIHGTGTAPFSSTPAIVGNVIYTTNGKALLAIDLHSGKVLWSFVDIPNPYGALLTSAVAVDPVTHIAYYGTPDARVYAVNTETHQGIWNVQLGDPAHGAFIWDSPLLVNGKLYIGLASHEDTPCVRGAAFALDPATGHIIWTHFTTPAGTIGGGIWSSIVADPSNHALIITTSNPCPAGPSIGEDDSIIALNWDTGALLWQFAVVQHDNCDCDFGQGAVAFVYQGRTYVVAGSKSGVEYAVSPSATSGQAPHSLWSLRLSGAGFLGTGGIYQPPTYHDGLLFFSGGPTPDGVCLRGALWAVDAATGVPRWRHCTADQSVGPTAMSNDILFAADTHSLQAYQAQTGKLVWTAPIRGPLWGGIAIAHGTVVVGTVPGTLHAYTVPLL